MGQIKLDKEREIKVFLANLEGVKRKRSKEGRKCSLYLQWSEGEREDKERSVVAGETEEGRERQGQT